jgi:hypothetical protein
MSPTTNNTGGNDEPNIVLCGNRSGHHNTELVGQNLRIVMSNILSYHISLRSEFRDVMSAMMSA